MNLLRPVLLLGLATFAAPAVADDNWFVRVGLHNVDPKSNNGTLAAGAFDVSIGSDARPTLAIGRFLDDNWAVEVLAALPFEHEVRLNGIRAVDFNHLPPTVALQYYFGSPGGFRPFVGAGLNYTWTYDVQEAGPLEGTRVDLGNSFGAAAQLGFTSELSERLHLTADIRWMDIDADVAVDGLDVGTVNVDPLVYGVYLGWRF